MGWRGGKDLVGRTFWMETHSSQKDIVHWEGSEGPRSQEGCGYLGTRKDFNGKGSWGHIIKDFHVRI